MHAVEAKTGKVVFDLPTGTPMFASMALAGDTLYLGNFGGKLTAIDLKTQKPAWVFETDGAKQNAAALTNADGTIKFEVVFSSPNLFYDDMVIAVHKLFTMGTILSSPVVVGNTVYESQNLHPVAKNATRVGHPRVPISAACSGVRYSCAGARKTAVGDLRPQGGDRA
jgi:outer membrane protein assembly factor BamB